MRSTHFPWSALSAVLLCALTLPARAQEGRLGVGIVLGEPTGIAWNYRTSHVNSVDGAVGLSPSDRFRLHADYLW